MRLGLRPDQDLEAIRDQDGKGGTAQQKSTKVCDVPQALRLDESLMLSRYP